MAIERRTETRRGQKEIPFVILPVIRTKPAELRQDIVYEKATIEGILCWVDRRLLSVVAIPVPEIGEPTEQLILGTRRAFKYSRLGLALDARSKNEVDKK